MRYRGDPSGERLTHEEMAQKVRLERCFGGRSQPGPKSGGRMPIKGPSPVPERVAPDYGPVGSRRPPPPRTVMLPPPPRGTAPPPIRMPFSPPLAPPQQSQGGRGRGGRGRGGVVGPQQPQGPMFLHPMGMPGLLQPPGPADPVQRLALMMALMVLGMPPLYSCHTTTGCGMPLDTGTSEPRVCLSFWSKGEIGISATKEELDTRQWKRLPAVHCMAMQSSLSFMCGPDGRTRKVRYEKFPTALRSAISGVLGSPEEWQTEGGGSRIPHNDEPDQESYGRRGGMYRKLQDTSRPPGKKNNSSTNGSPGGGRLDLVE